MRFRSLGRSGLTVSEITYGNWITHGGQVGEDMAASCVRAALDHGITTFDTADVYAAGAAEEEKGGGAEFIRPPLGDDVLERVQQLRPLADQAGLSMAAFAVAWVLQEDNVAAAIIGASRPEQIIDNARAVGVRLPAELKARADELLAPVVETDPALTHSPNPRP